MKFHVENALLLVFFAAMMWLGPGTLWGHTLEHDYPYGYSSSDAYQHQVRAEWVASEGSYANEYRGIVTGYDDVIGYYMPGGFQLAAAFSHASGLPSYDALYVMVYFAAILAAMVLYFAIRSHNRHVALLSLPLTTLIFAKTFYMGIILGQWPFTFGTLFLAGSLWALTKLDLKLGGLLVALFVSAVALTHTSELVFVIGFMGVALLLTIIKKEWGKTKALVGAGILTAAASIYYIIIFSYTWGKQFGYHFYVEHVNQGFPNVRIFNDFQLWMIVVMLAGMIGIYYRSTIISFAAAMIVAAIVKVFDLQNSIRSDAAVVIMYMLFIALFLYVVWKRQPNIVQAFGPYMLIIGYSAFIGFGPRAFQTRFMWPVTLAPLLGLGLYRLIKLASSRGKIRWSMLHTAITTVILAAVIIGANYEPLSTPGTMYKERWEMFQWLQDNTENDARVLFLYGDGYEQTSMLYNSGRENYLVIIEDYIDGLNKQMIKEDYEASRNMDYGPGLPYREGLLDFNYHLYELPEQDKDICGYDYYVFDKVTGRQQLAPLIQYNNAIRQVFVQNGMEVAFENAATSIVKNENIGGDCIGQNNA